METVFETWPKLIKERVKVPEEFIGEFDKIAGHSGNFPYTIHIPYHYRGFKKYQPGLVCVSGQKIIILEKINRGISTSVYDMNNICLMETGSILLNSWIKINGLINNDAVSTIIDYNTVGHIFFEPILEKIRMTVNRIEKKDPEKGIEVEKSKLDIFAKTNFKFMNFGRDSLLSGEHIIRIILQPEIKEPFLRYFKRYLSRTHLTILTDKEFIIIKEDEKAWDPKMKAYGGIRQYIPLNKIKNISAEEKEENNLISLNIILPAGDCAQSLFEASKKDELNQMIDEIKTSII